MKKYAKEKFYMEINENVKDIKSSNSRLYWKTIKMLLKMKVQITRHPRYMIRGIT
jgi:hypothetical protein